METEEERRPPQKIQTYELLRRPGALALESGGESAGEHACTLAALQEVRACNTSSSVGMVGAG